MNERPQEVFAWAINTFGVVATLPDERVKRFLEEAIEVAHAYGLSERMLDAIIGRVYARQRGEIAQEIGQAQMTLECLAESFGLSADAEAGREFERVKALPKEHFIQRQNAKAALGIAGESPEAA